MSQNGRDRGNERWMLTALRGALGHYKHRPELMVPFVAQSFLSTVLSGLSVRFSSVLGAETISVLAFATLSLASLAIQGWALCWYGDVLAGRSSPLRAFQRALKRWVSLLGVSFLAALPGALLTVVVLGSTSGWVLLLGTSLVAALINWLVLLAIAAVVLDRRRAWHGVREAFLALGEPRRALTLFLVLLCYGVFNAYWGDGVLLLGGSGLRGWGQLGVVSWQAFNALSSPVLYLLLVAFYRDHVNVLEQETLA